MKDKSSIIVNRIVCACTRKRFIAEDVESGKVPCKCGELNEIENGKAIKHYPNKLAQSYQAHLQQTLKKKGA